MEILDGEKRKQNKKPKKMIINGNHLDLRIYENLYKDVGNIMGTSWATG